MQSTESRECRVESTGSAESRVQRARVQSREEGADCTMRAQHNREYRVESADSRHRECENAEYRECENAEYRESRVQSREYRECKGTESRGGSTVHDESTV
jgi:hypothetical protein